MEAILATITAVLTQIVQLGPTILATAEDVTPFAQEIANLFSGTNVTQAQLDTLTANIATLSAQLQASAASDATTPATEPAPASTPTEPTSST